LIPGHATAEGTRRFRQRAEASGVERNHFREFKGLHLTSLGFGTYLGEIDRSTDALVEEAFKSSVLSGGINVIDTAINYRLQKAERSIGRALEELIKEERIQRDELLICTKNGYLSPDGDSNLDLQSYVMQNLMRPGIIQPKDVVQGMHCMTKPYLKDQLERSLRNLSLDCIDLIYLHNAAESQIAEVGREEFLKRLGQAFEFYEEQRAKGKIQWYGMATWSCFRVDETKQDYVSLEQVVDTARSVGGDDHAFRFIQLPFNLEMSEARTLKAQTIMDERVSILEAAHRLGVGVFTSVPLMQGRILHQPSLPRKENMESPAITCLQFARSAHISIIAPLVGQKQSAHTKENLLLAKYPPLTEEEFEETFMAAKADG